MSLLRRVRAALGIGVVWATGWALAGAVGFSLFWSALAPYQQARLDAFASAPFDFRLAATLATAALGLAGGIGFSVFLATAERRRTIDRLSVWRVSAWGAAAGLLTGIGGGLALGGLATFAAPMVLITALGGISAGATLRIAARPPRNADAIPRLPDARPVHH